MNDTGAPRREREIIVTEGQTACARCRAVIEKEPLDAFLEHLRATYAQRHGVAFETLIEPERRKNELYWTTVFGAIQNARARGDVEALKVN